MNISEPFIRRPVMTILVMASILFFGTFAYKNLPVSDLPSIEFPTLQVIANYPGANPETMANTVSYPLEREFTSIEGLKSISSTSSTGSTTIVLQFNLDKSIDSAATDVLSTINQALPYLPPDLPSNPTYQKVNPTKSPILYFAIASDTTTRGQLYDYGYSYLGQQLSMINGVEQILSFGAPTAVRVQVDPDKLFAKQIGIDQVAAAIADGNPELSTGTLYGPDIEYSLDVDGQLLQAEGYNSLTVRTENGELVRISDLGEAIDSLQNDKYSFDHRTKTQSLPGIVLGVQKQDDANAVQVIQDIKTTLKKLEKNLPKNVQIFTLFDQSQWIFQSVDDVEFTLLIAFLLVIVVVLFYLGRVIDTIIPLLVLPLAIVGTFAAMYFLNYNLDILSLMAITLSIGFLVDDAIVVLENIARHTEEGIPPLQASLEGSKQISLTILSMTLCLASIFLPLIFMGGVVGRIFREFGGTIIAAVLISGFIALTLTPLLCSRFIRARHEKKKNWIEKTSEKLNQSLLNAYKKSLVFVIHHRFITLLAGLGSVVVTIYLFGAIAKDFLPPDDLGFIQGYTVSADGTSPYKMIKYQKEVTEMLIQDPNVDNITAVAGIPEDNEAFFFVSLKPYKEREPMQTVIPAMNEKLGSLPGINTFLKAYPLINLQIGTEAAKGNYQYTLQSIEEDTLYSTAQKMIDAMRQIPGLTQVTSDMHVSMPRLHFTIDRDRAYDLNISAKSIEQSLSYAYAGSKISQINGTQNQYWVILETIPSAYKDPSILSKLYISSNNNSPIPTISNAPTTPKERQSNGTQIPLSLITNYTETTGPLSINHYNIFPSVTITFDLKDIPLGTALDRINAQAKDIIPQSVTSGIVGTADVFQAAFSSLQFLFIIALFILYVILGILYENFIHPITVMSVLPPAALGGLVTLFIFGLPLSLYAFVGIMMLLGIVLKNGVMMVDFANEAISKRGLSIEEAIKYACFTRFRPIIMTTFAAIMGALPIALGVGGLTALSRRPLGIVVVGGLIFSQILTLFLTPVIFIYLETLREKFRKIVKPMHLPEE